MTREVELVTLRKDFGSFRAVDDVSLTVPQGSFFTLLGPSGCGKSTILRMVAGFEMPDSGDVVVAGRSMRGVPPERRPVNMVFQRWALFPHLSVARNVAFGLQAEGLDRRETRARVGEMLELTGLSALRDRLPSQLSGGQMQRVALARALAKRPKVLLLDEPLTALDMRLRQQIQIELKRLQRELGSTFLFVTHDQGEAMSMSDRIAVMRNGCVEQAAAPREIYDAPRTRFVADFIGNTNAIAAEVLGLCDGIARLRIGGREMAAQLTDAPAPASGAAARGTLYIRYERLALSAPQEGAPGLPCRVADVVFSGNVVRYVLRLDSSDEELVAEVPHDGASAFHTAGTALLADWKPQAARLFPDVPEAV